MLSCISNMEKRLKEQLPFLEFIESRSTTKSQINTILNQITPEQIKVLCEVFLNIRYGTFQISEGDKYKLKRKIKFIRKLTTRRTTQSERKQLIVDDRNFVVSVIQKFLPVIKAAIEKNGNGISPNK